MNNLTIIMYHYVRPISISKFPNIKGLELERFKNQLDYLVENYNVITTQHVIDACNKNLKLPKNACWLTFDDGYKDHSLYVFPELLKRNLHGAFFPPRIAIEKEVTLDVNSIQYIISCANDISELVTKLNEMCKSYNISDKQLNLYYKKYGIKNRFDNTSTIYFKRMLQHVLPEEIRNTIISELFKHYVGISEKVFSNNLYMNVSELKQLVSNGMYVGSHGSMHYWLDRISPEKQRIDIQDSLTFLEHIGSSTNSWVMCYPYGAYNNDTLSILKRLGASVGITTEAREADISKDNKYTLPRLDTNDFPQ